jgi:hypothetical protein
MLLTDRVHISPHICGIEVDFSAQEFAAGNFDVQPFYNTNLSDANFKSIYYSIGSASFRESSNLSAQGTSYVQKVTLKFPSADKNRSQRLEQFRNVKFISVKLSNNLKILIGRNDFFQNSKPKVEVSSNEKVTTVEFTSVSIAPSGFSENTVAYGFPYQLPISLIEPI